MEIASVARVQSTDGAEIASGSAQSGQKSGAKPCRRWLNVCNYLPEHRLRQRPTFSRPLWITPKMVNVFPSLAAWLIYSKPLAYKRLCAISTGWAGRVSTSLKRAVFPSSGPLRRRWKVTIGKPY